MTLKDAMARARVSYRMLGRDVQMSPAALCRLIDQGEYPARRDIGDVRKSICAALMQSGINPNNIEFPKPASQRARIQVELEDNAGAGRKAAPLTTEDMDLMQLSREVLNHFGLRRHPFLNDVEADDDVFPFKAHERITEAIHDTIRERGLLALVGPSGSGKTTIWDGVEEQFHNSEDVKICKPKLTEKDKLSPGHLNRALIYGLVGESERIPNNAEDCGRKVARHLAVTRDANYTAVLYIDDAHFASTRVLRQLKTFHEQKIGRYRLLSIILVGLEELEGKLALFPEVGNRTRLVRMPPVPVKEYLEFKLRRVGSGIEKLFEPPGWDAFLDVFRPNARSIARGYPLDINTACIRSMVARCEDSAGAEKITPDVVDRIRRETRRAA